MAEEILQDQAARQTIGAELDKSLMVLAGAGAGKTHALIERMVNCVRTGKVEVDRIAAITFTRKAAGEMRGRFFLELRKKGRKASGAEAERIQRALERIDQCFIGTIHSFCGRLLRERPVEAGLSPDFAEMEERDEAVLRRDIWDRFIQHCFINEDPRLDKLEKLGLRTEDLYTFFKQRCVFNDMLLKETATKSPDLRPAVEQARIFIEEVEAYIPDELPKGRDGFMEMSTQARHFLRYRTLEADGDYIAFLRLLEGKIEVKITYWGENRNYAKKLRDELLPHFQENALAPVLMQWRQHVYFHAKEFVNEAMGYYDAERHAAGRLTFQDLLQKATALLRDHAGVRQYFQKRYQRLFVDEFQDTDPVQAEMLFFLTGTDSKETDWHKLKPREGSLFLVGDEKQSIYRFRRADVETFRLVSERIAKTGGGVVELDTSFRSLGRLCDWINHAFPSLFGAHQQDYQAQFSPLFKFRPDGADACGVRKISIDRIYRHSRAEIVSQDAERIADFIAAAVAGQTEFNGNGEDAVLEEHASPGDFMILTRTTGYLALYARALEERGLPFDIAGGGRLGEATELKALMDMLEAIHMPDNPLPFLGYLRGPFVGLGDDELYAYRRVGGDFNYRYSLPEDLSVELQQRLEEARERLERIARWLQENPPATAFEWMLEDLGLVPFSATREMGSSRAGNLLRLLALVREWEGQGMHWGQILAEMRELVDDPDYKVEEMTLESGREDVVRLMNLHQAKGLENKIVFLADPYDISIDRHSVEFHVSRTGDPPFLSMPVRRPKGPHHAEIIAEPREWADDVDEEERFLEAENLRLLYVAATRARDLLIVSCYEGNPEKGPWAPLYPFLNEVPELPVCVAPPLPEPEILPLDWDHQRCARAESWQRLKRSTYIRHSVTDDEPDDEVLRSSEGGLGKEYGSVVHRLLEAAVQERLPGDEKAYIRYLLGEAALDPALAETAKAALDGFRRSAIWKEIEQAKDAFSEVPFAVPEEEEGIPGVLRGIIDLVYRTPGGWKIVDYKTDSVSGDADMKAFIERCGRQVNAYAKAWEIITGETVFEKGIWVTDQDRFMEITQ